MLNKHAAMIRRAALILALLAYLGGLAACGDDGNDRAPASDPDAADADAGAGGAFPVTNEPIYGTPVIPAAPPSVVTAGFNDTDYARPFGLIPRGGRCSLGQFTVDRR